MTTTDQQLISILAFLYADGTECMTQKFLSYLIRLAINKHYFIDPNQRYSTPYNLRVMEAKESLATFLQY